MQTSEGHVKLSVKNRRYVCPNCKQLTNQQANPQTNAEHLILWCRSCKAEFVVNIDHGQCSIVSRCR